MTHHPEVEKVATELVSKVRHFAGKGQYEDGSPEQDAYLDGVETAIGMMYIDLTGTPKSGGMLTSLISRIEEGERERHAKEVNRILNLHSLPIAEGGLDYVKAFEEMERYEHRLFKAISNPPTHE